MPHAPTPDVPLSLLAAASRLRFRPVAYDAMTGVELGEFVDGDIVRPLILARSDAGAVEWRIVDELPARFSAWLFSRDTFEMLHEGTIGPDGTIIAPLQIDCDGYHNIASAIPG